MQNAECKMQNRESKTKNGLRPALRRNASVLSFCILHFAFCIPAHATMTQEDVFKSINDNVSNSGDASGRMFLALLLGAAAVLMLLSLISLRRKRVATPRAVNHPGKLLKELTKKISLRPAEIKQLKLLAEGERNAGNPIDDPLLFIICPSTFAAAMRSGRAKVDRKVLAGLARKMGLIAGKK